MVGWVVVVVAGRVVGLARWFRIGNSGFMGLGCVCVCWGGGGVISLGVVCGYGFVWWVCLVRLVVTL